MLNSDIALMGNFCGVYNYIE